MKCTVCKEEVKYPKWDCEGQPGNHTVESKTYYHPYAQNIQDVRDRRFNNVHMVLFVTADRVDEQGQKVRGRLLEVTFQAGRYQTANPEEQYFLDKKQAEAVLCDEERWKKIYLTDEQRLNLRENALKEREERLTAAENNPLLEKVKARG